MSAAIPAPFRGTLLCLGVISALGASAAGAADSIASRFSPKWRALEAELTALDTALARLPGIPVEDFGGTRPFLQVFSAPRPEDPLAVDFTIRLRWPDPVPVNLIALVPAHKIDSLGLDPNYGFPEDFTVSPIQPDGGEPTLASFTGTSANPVHQGHPIVVKIPEEPTAGGLEIRITRARPPRPGAPNLIFVALAEILCFSGDHNVAGDATVELVSEHAAELPSYWSPEMLIDGVTPLGFPERPRPEGEEAHIGWLSDSRLGADEGLAIRLDLGTETRVDGLRLFPALRPSIGDFPGFGIPEHFRLVGVTDGNDSEPSILLDHTSESTPSVGHNPLEFHFEPTVVREVQLDAVRLWKPYPFYPAFLALSEIQLLDGDEVVSGGAAVQVPEADVPVPAQGDLLWSPQSLTDGRGPHGVLIPRRHWIEDLDKRLALEKRRHEALSEMRQLETQWQRGTLAAVSSLGLIAFGFAAVLPFRYRRRERRRVRRIRERIAGDLHDDVGSNLGSIQMLSTMARDMPDSRKELETIHQVAAETVNSVRDIVWLLHPRGTDRVPTIDHLRESAAILLDTVEWTLESDFRDWKLGDEDGRHLVLFFREALHNIRRHAEATEVQIHVCVDHDEFVLTIADNGRGIAQDRLDRPSSLRALRQRAERLGGRIEVDTAEGTGTTVTLRFVPSSPGSDEGPIPHSDSP